MTDQELKARIIATVDWLDKIGFKRIVDEDRKILVAILSEVDKDPRPEAPMLGAKACYLNGYKKGYEDTIKLLREQLAHAKDGCVKLADDQSLPLRITGVTVEDEERLRRIELGMLKAGWRKVKLVEDYQPSP